MMRSGTLRRQRPFCWFQICSSCSDWWFPAGWTGTSRKPGISWTPRSQWTEGVCVIISHHGLSCNPANTSPFQQYKNIWSDEKHLYFFLFAAHLSFVPVWLFVNWIFLVFTVVHLKTSLWKLWWPFVFAFFWLYILWKKISTFFDSVNIHRRYHSDKPFFVRCGCVEGPTRWPRWERCSGIAGTQGNAGEELRTTTVFAEINCPSCLRLSDLLSVHLSFCPLFQGQDGRDGYGPSGPKGVKVEEISL